MIVRRKSRVVVDEAVPDEIEPAALVKGDERDIVGPGVHSQTGAADHYALRARPGEHRVDETTGG